MDGAKYKLQRCYLCVGREETANRSGGAIGKEVANLGKPLCVEEPSDLMGHIATAQGGPASKHLVDLPKEKPSQMLSVMGMERS